MTEGFKKVCIVCATNFVATQRNYKTCSKVCEIVSSSKQRKEYYSKNKKTIIARISKNKKSSFYSHICAICSSSFMGRKGTKCCKESCRSTLNSNKSKDRYKNTKHNSICLKCNNSFLAIATQKECKKCYILNKANSDDILSRKRELKRQYVRNKYRTDLNFRLADNLRSRLNTAIKSTKAGSAVNNLGCSIEELKIYLESLFQPDMTWDNYGKNGWHIDHIKPLSKFDLSDIEQLKEGCNYINLQPLWAKDNLKKSNK